jgi:tetratricopeptide (TPR) repeat protein
MKMSDVNKEENTIQKSNNSLTKISNQISIVDKIISSSHNEKRKKFWKDRLDLLKEKEKWDELLSESEKCIEEFPKWEYGYFRRATVKYINQNYQGAFEDSNIAIEINNKLSVAYQCRGLIREELKDYFGAIEDFSKVIELDSKNNKAYLQRGLARDYLKRYEEAHQDFQEAVKLNTKDPYAYFYLSMSKFYGMGDLKGAIDEMEKVLSISPEYWVGTGNMLKICYELSGELKSLSGDIEGAELDKLKAIEIKGKSIQNNL